MISVFLLTTAVALGGWGASPPLAGGPVGSTAETENRYEWRSYPADPGRSYLYRDGVQAAGYDQRTGVYRIFHAETGEWGPAQAAPWETPVADVPVGKGAEPNCGVARSGDRATTGDVPAETHAEPNYGVDTSKLNGRREERYRLNGLPASKEQVEKALGVGNQGSGIRSQGSEIRDQELEVPDDAGRLRLTVIGGRGVREQVARDLASVPGLAEWKERLLVQSYPPEDWAVARTGFVTNGQPTIYLQAPDGKVLHRQDDYRDGPEGLVQALRRADPHYDPRKDPDLRKLPARPRLDLSSVPAPVWLLAAGGLYLVLGRARK